MIPDGFWSHDYSSGVEAVTRALNLSVAENKQFLAMVQERARIEHNIATSLAQLSQEPVMHAVPSKNGEYVSKSSSLQTALSVFTTETVNQAVLHTRIASGLDSQVRAPLQKWCNMYAKRVETCCARLTSLVSGYNRLLQAVNKQKTVYYENCQKLEDSVSGGSPKDPIIKTIRILRDKWNTTSNSGSGSAQFSSAASATSKSHTAAPGKQGGSPRTYTIAGLKYTRAELADLLRLLLADIVLIEYKVPLLGSYHSVTSGSMLSTAARKHLQNDSFAYAEKFGQSLVDLGFLKPVGQITNRYQSLHTSYYQWQPQAFELVDEESSSSESDTSSIASTQSSHTPAGTAPGKTPRAVPAEASAEAPGEAPAEAPTEASADASLSNDVSNDVSESTVIRRDSESSSARSISRRSETSSTDTAPLTATDPSEEHYLQAVIELDKYRCDMELEIMDLYEFLDKLERDREAAIKRGMQDYIQIAFRIEEQQEMQLRMKTAQHHIDPVRDLDQLTHANKTGPFVPTVTVFRGYFNGNVVQTFGVDLAQSKFLVQLILDWLTTLPETDTKQLSLWTHPEPIKEIYKLRHQINTGKPFQADGIFKFFPLSVVVSTFRQYLLELPESLVPFIVYERFKQLYSDSEPSSDTIATVLVQIPLVNRLVLQDLIKYLRNQFEPDTYTALGEALALPIVRPRAPSSVTMDDTHPAKLVRDLLLYESEIFEKFDRKYEEAQAHRVESKLPSMNRNYMQGPPSPQTPSHSHSHNNNNNSNNSRVASNSGMRPLSLSMGSSRTSQLTPIRNENEGTKSPSPKLSSSGSRGLGFNPILPVNHLAPPSLSSSAGTTSQAFAPQGATSSQFSTSPGSPSPLNRLNGSPRNGGDIRVAKTRDTLRGMPTQ